MKTKTKRTKPKRSGDGLALEKLQAEIKALEKAMLNRPRYDGNSDIAFYRDVILIEGWVA